MKRSISLLSHSLSNNAFGRAWVLADLLKHDFDVHVVVACAPDEQIWEPVRNSCDFEIRRYPVRPYPLFLAARDAIARQLVTGELIYAVKPRLASYGLALAARRQQRRPLMLDIDDLEKGFSSLRSDVLGAPWALLSMHSGLHTRLLSRRTAEADAVTVSSTKLHQHYGGTWIPHARDASLFVPRTAQNEAPTAIFIGTPRKHKGLDRLLDAFHRVQAPARLRIIGGALDAGLVKQAQALGDARISVEPTVPFSDLPAQLASADLVVIPQDCSPVSEAQLPAKLLDAMAMGKAVLSTRVGDIPRWLADGAGHVVEPGDTRALAEAMDNLLREPAQLAAMGERARARFLALGSREVVQPRLVGMVETLLRGERVVPLAPFEDT